MRRASPALLAGVAAAGIAGCLFSTGYQIRTHELLRPAPIGVVNAFNMEERLEHGWIPEILAFFGKQGQKAVEDTRSARVLGQALLERGDFTGSRPLLERAHAQEGRIATRADLAWLLSQRAYWAGDFAESARWGGIARSEGRNVPDGWIAFLASGASKKAYDGAATGARLKSGVSYGRPNLLRVAVRVNGTAPDQLVLDTGASISLLTESAAARFGVEPIEGATAFAYGLHDTAIPLRFGWAKTLEIGGVTVANVPFGILSDEALAFQTTASGPFHFAGVLGVHLMKEFDWRIEYAAKQVVAVRLDPAIRRGSADQNLFFRRLKPMVRASLNQEPWYLFLLDTGSEPTMITRAGIRRRGSAELESSYPMTLEGIGKSRVSWGKLSHTAVGIDRFMIRFDDIVVKEENLGIEDGVVGSSFLAHFDVQILFGAMRLKLERPFEKLLEAQNAAPPPGR